jgi:urea transport system permease protein
MLAFFRNDMGLGGNNGLTDFKEILGFPCRRAARARRCSPPRPLALAGGYLLCRAVIVSKLGKVLVAVRDAESRTRFLGYRVESYKLVVFTLSAMLAGVAGALYVPQVGIINPGEFAPANSIEIVIWVAVGGRGTLAGAALGALVVNAAKTWLTGAMPDAWLFALGGSSFSSPCSCPKGISAPPQERSGAWRERTWEPRSATAPAGPIRRSEPCRRPSPPRSSTSTTSPSRSTASRR